MGPSDAQVVVGTLAVVVHLHEAGLGFLVDLRPTDPRLVILAVDRQALLLKVVVFWEREGVVVMVIQRLFLRSSPPRLPRRGKRLIAIITSSLFPDEEVNFSAQGCV